MATPYRVKRRAAGGAAGAPSTLLQSELAYSEVDQILYIGQGTGGTATVVAIGGPGAYLTSATAASTYLTSATASSTYLTQSSASSTYLTQASAASTYVTQASAASYASTSYVDTAISNLVNGAGTALDTLKELADALGNDASFSTTISTSLGNKADRTLSNLTDAGTARTNLGLGSMATQAANNVAITGGSIDGVTLDGGTF